MTDISGQMQQLTAAALWERGGFAGLSGCFHLYQKLKVDPVFLPFPPERPQRSQRGRRTDVLTQADEIKQAKMIPSLAGELCFLGFSCHRSAFDSCHRSAFDFFSFARFLSVNHQQDPCPGIPSPATASPFPFPPSLTKWTRFFCRVSFPCL